MNEETPIETVVTPVKKRRGFAAMDPAKVRAIAHEGGLAAHRKGTAHHFTPEAARAAGRKGGLAPHRSRGHSVVRGPSQDRPSTESTG
jgi:uncharacterized protein